MESVALDPLQEPAYRGDEVIIDGTGHTLMPGLIDAHVHVHDMHLPVGSNTDNSLVQPLRCGINTMCDMHTEPNIVSKYRAKV